MSFYQKNFKAQGFLQQNSQQTKQICVIKKNSNERLTETHKTYLKQRGFL